MVDPSSFRLEEPPCGDWDHPVRSGCILESNLEFAEELGDELVDGDDLVDPVHVLTA